MEDGNPGGAALMACALAGLTRKAGTQASAPAAAAPDRNARRDGFGEGVIGSPATLISGGDQP
jgi:hypothetical protein